MAIPREPTRYLGDTWDEFVDVTDRAPAYGERLWAPAVDVRETQRTYYLEADLPGMGANDVDVRVEGDRLVLTGGKEEKREEKDEGYIMRERYARRFSRRFRLPSDVNKDKIEAEFKDGVLTVKMPRSGDGAEAKGKSIKVKSG